MAVCFIHTADWQIGKAFASLPEEARGRLVDARLEAVKSIARLACEQNADAVLVAGDVFDSATVSDLTLRRTLNSLEGFAGPWVLLPGNHDAALAESPWTRIGRLQAAAAAGYANAVLATVPEPLVLAEGRLTVLPAPLQRHREVVDLTEWFDGAASLAGSVRVGLAHGSVSGFLPAEADAGNPIARDRSERAGLDYLALGDWHGTLPVGPRTWYAGTPEPDRFKANDPGNALVVRIYGPGAMPQVEKVRIGHFFWHELAWPVHGEEDINALWATVAGLDGGVEQTVIRLTLTGAIDLRTRLRVNEAIDDLRARVHGLDVADDGLLAEPSDDDLDQIDTLGFVRAAIETLRAKSRNPTDPERDTARHALQILYLEHRRAG